MSLGGVIGGWPKREITKYRTERIVRSEPEDKSAQTPGLLCWGDAGTLPAPVPVSTGFEIVKSEHVEKSRETELVNIYDQNNPDNYITQRFRGQRRQDCGSDAEGYELEEVAAQSHVL
jgi:hypothetical protein